MAVLSCKCARWGSFSIYFLRSPLPLPPHVPQSSNCGSSNSFFFRVILPCHDAHICKLYGAEASLPSLPLRWMQHYVTQRLRMLNGFVALLPLKLFRSLSFSRSLFAAYAVIANGQVECPKGFKRMNLTHCQGKLQHMFKNVSAEREKKEQPLHLPTKTKLLYNTGPWKWVCWLSVSKFTRTPGGGVTIKLFLSVRMAPQWEPGQDYN